MPLDPQKLEEILIEKSLGTLSPEAELLLSDYLERNPPTASLADQYREVIDLAEKVLASGNPVSLPPFPTKALQAAGRKWNWQIKLKHSLSWAACLAIGFMIGLAITGWNHQLKPNQEQSVAAAPVLKREPLSASKSSFWSIPLTARPAENRERKGLRLIWKSPVEQPSIGG